MQFSGIFDLKFLDQSARFVDGNLSLLKTMNISVEPEMVGLDDLSTSSEDALSVNQALTRSSHLMKEEKLEEALSILNSSKIAAHTC